jgi:hypothetical protein
MAGFRLRAVAAARIASVLRRLYGLWWLDVGALPTSEGMASGIPSNESKGVVDMAVWYEEIDDMAVWYEEIDAGCSSA